MQTEVVDYTYYDREKGPKKQKVDIVRSFVESAPDINFIYDVGCNNGNMSYPLQRDLGKRVVGLDLSSRLNTPKDYHFVEGSILTSRDVVFNDCTFFLSLYHHILGAHGLQVADNVFYKLLLRTKYLVFDSGNLSESKRRGKYWQAGQKGLFPTEKDLLDHFGLAYRVIGEWGAGGGKRSVVVFTNNSFDQSVAVVQKYKRKYGIRFAKSGLFDYDEVIKREHQGAVYHKLGLGEFVFFAKKHRDEQRNLNEKRNIVFAYKQIDSGELIDFFGWSDKYGLIFEWCDDIKWVRRSPTFAVGGIALKDVDVVDVNGQRKLIDFER